MHRLINSISISSENFQNIQGREIEVFPKKLEKLDKPPRNLRNSLRIYYPFYFLSKIIEMIPRVTVKVKCQCQRDNVKGGTGAVAQRCSVREGGCS